MDERRSIGEARALVRDLRALGAVEAPETLLSSVLRALGLGDAYFSVELPIGRVFVAHNARGISAVALAESSDDFERRFAAQHGRGAYGEGEPPADLRDVVRQALASDERPALHFDLSGLTEFERAVLLKAVEIPRGEVRPYGWIAREIGRPKAVRAVGTALGHNPIPLLIPCHRVVRSDGHLGQYSMGGEAVKRAVLTLEGTDVATLDTLAGRGVRYLASDLTHEYCLPTCRDARIIPAAHRMTFQSRAQAEAAGYRPCPHCRPA